MGNQNNQTHTQCNLRRVNGQMMTSWIPSKYAVKGKFLKLKNESGEWENGWEVMATYSTASSPEVSERSRDYKHQRKASDIPRGKRLKVEA